MEPTRGIALLKLLDRLGVAETVGAEAVGEDEQGGVAYVASQGDGLRLQAPILNGGEGELWGGVTDEPLGISWGRGQAAGEDGKEQRQRRACDDTGSQRRPRCGAPGETRYQGWQCRPVNTL